MAKDMGNYYRIPPDLRDLNYSKYTRFRRNNKCKSSHSDNTTQLDVEGMKLLLKKLKFIKLLLEVRLLTPKSNMNVLVTGAQSCWEEFNSSFE